MTKAKFATVDAYLDSLSPTAQAALARVRSAIRRALPQAEETISYQMPTYKLHGRAIIYFAGWKEHYSLYPATADLTAAFATELAPYQIEKGTIRFPLNQPVPAKLITRLAKFRAQEAAARGK